LASAAAALRYNPTLTRMSDRQLHIHWEPGLWPPSWPMGLTMLRLLLLPVFLYVLLTDANSDDHRYRWLAVGIFVIMAITDKLDGYLARRLKQTSKMGMLLDPVADKLLIACSVILLSFTWVAPRGYVIPKYVVFTVYGKDLVVAFGSLLLLSLIGKVDVTPRVLGKLGTFLQLSMVIATLIAKDLEWVSERAAWVMTRSLWVGTAAVSATSCVDNFVQGCLQYSRAKKKEMERPMNADEHG
jgi:CDP-diacylglycerol--glycerol-3-phosphate 3-phosphatidyltransferase